MDVKDSKLYKDPSTNKRVRTWNPFVGCRFACAYCYLPIYRKRLKCPECKIGEPHFHDERLNQKFKAGDTVFCCSMGDISFIRDIDFAQILDVFDGWDETTFLLQSKNPSYFRKWKHFPDNLYLGTTIETNYVYDFLGGLSKAPHPYDRKEMLAKTSHNKKYVTCEPIMGFDLGIMLGWIKDIKPEFVYIGRNNYPKLCQLPEPSREKIDKLIEELKKFTEVRIKTL